MSLVTVPDADATEHEPECSPLFRVAEPLCQGDVFEWRAPGEDPWRRWGVIITADCDLHLEKHGGILSYVPILSLEAFLVTQWLPEQLERRLRHQIGLAVGELRKLIDPEGRSGLTEQGVLEWLVREGVDGVMGEFGGRSASACKRLRESLEICARILNARNTGTFTEKMQQYVAIAAATGDGKIEAAETREWNRLENYVQRLPGDCFFLSMLSPMHRGGFVAYLRRIQEVHAAQFATSTLELERAEVIRISRLNPPYKYTGSLSNWRRCSLI